MKFKKEEVSAQKRFSLLVVLFLYIAPAFILTMTHNRLVDEPYEKVRQEWYSDIVSLSGKAPDQYRILVFKVSEFLQSVGVSFRYSFLSLRFIFILAALIAFHAYLRKWFDEKTCIIGALFAASTFSLTYYKYFFQETDVLNFIFFIAGYALILSRKDRALPFLLLLATFNRETAVLLVLVYFFFRYDELKIRELFLRTGVMLLAVFFVYLGIRKYIGIREYYCDIFWSDFNLRHIETYTYPFLLMGPFAVLAFIDFSKKPKFLKRAALMIPFFLVIHWVIGAYSEQRLFLPLIPVLLPLGLMSLFRVYPQEPEFKPEKDLFQVKYAKPGYVLIFVLFLVFFNRFYRITEEKQVRQYRNSLEARALVSRGIEMINDSRFKEAEETLQKASAFIPDDAELNYVLGFLYSRVLPDKTRAARHLKKASENDKKNQFGDKISAELKALGVVLPP